MAEPVQSNGTQSPLYGGRLADVVSDLDLHDMLLERGTSGLRRSAGFIREEPLTDLVGQAGIRKYTEMKNNSAVVGSCLFAFEMLLRQVTWQLQPADKSPEAQRYADLVQGMLFHDIDQP